MNTEYEYKFYYWGPLLFNSKLKDDDLEKVKNICNKDPKKSCVDILAGDIKHEYNIDKDILNKIFQPYMSGFKDAYAKWYDESINYIYVNKCWVNYMQPGDYNPIHIHTNCDFSSVLYIDIPKELQKEMIEYKGKSAGPGAINFLYGEINNYFISTINKKPVTGEFFIFPSGLRHTVNPHKSKCERISVGINFAIQREKNESS
jgi:uncharacterized protein (TIGR02466 family)|tara:strand:- start:195 stop:803 length:609 start_codon:yes stop_codon:yes gene_type:complete